MVCIYVFLQLTGKFVDLSDLARQYAYKIPKLLGTGILFYLLVILLCLLLMVPGVIYGVFWLFFVQVVLYTDLRGRSALRHSKQLVQGKWRKTLGFALAIGITVSVLVLPLFLQL
ncbi:MAG: hypothetical protein H6765_10935 [Candidatus Peribacteria bacterium]|nr:MAG: hypothetical protein H6765_10935 [Candidatus Peribacteria bacterium]